MKRKKTKAGAKKKQKPKIKLNQLAIPAGLLLLVITSLIATGYFIFLRPGPAEKKLAVEKPLQQPSYEQEVAPPVEPTLPSIPPEHNQLKPQIAIVIDDMGYRKAIGDALLHMDLDLTFSFLPHAPNAASQAQKAQELGRDILLHLPLEPNDPTWDLGPGGIYTSMSKKELISTFNANLAVVPMAVGINNHMGSLFTESKEAMQTLFEIIKVKDLFFLDSLTSSHSLGHDLARSMKIKTAKRNLFLDNEHEDDKVGIQLLKLVTLAEQQGYAIGLAHPFPSTLAALRKHEKIFKTRVELVGVSKLVQ